MKCNFLSCVINGSNILGESNAFTFPFILITVARLALQDPSGSVQFARCHLCSWALSYGLIYLDHLSSKVHVMDHSTQRGKNTGLHQSECSEKSDIYNITVAGGVYNSASEVSKGRHVLISSYCCLANTNTFLQAWIELGLIEQMMGGVLKSCMTSRFSFRICILSGRINSHRKERASDMT